MAAVQIPIPGRTTSRVEIAEVRPLGRSNDLVRFVVRYEFMSAAGRQMVGELTFQGVLEYRWVAECVYYEDFPIEIPEEADLGLYEVTGSPYKENALSKCMYGQFPTMRIGGGNIPEDELHHYALYFPDFGGFHVLAMGVDTSERAAESAT